MKKIVVGLVAFVSAGAFAGPVDVYLYGPKHCPQDRPNGSPRITEAQAIERTKQMLPDDFCGPSFFVSGCTYLVENYYDSWRVYVEQYKDVAGQKDKGGLKHTYLILDGVGNCLAHIPGTEFGALN
ncbi:MAG TPA: hypothetical protein VMN56_09265 [Casimicrobiaceae bacterium]|nr:hypothetical protein [Casimicrobiaceae bacterium]